MTPFNNDENIRVSKTYKPSGFHMNKLDVYHSYFGIGFRLTGESVITTLENNYIVQENDIILIGNELLHRSSYNSLTEITGLRIQFDYTIYEKLCSLMGKVEIDHLFNQVVIHIRDEKKAKIKAIFEALESEYTNECPSENMDHFSKDIQFSILHILFMNIFRYQTPKAINRNSTLPLQDTLSKALTFMEANYSKDPSLKNTSMHCNVSESYLSKQFKKCFNMNYSDYLNKIKVNCARNLLAKTNTPLCDIPLQCGFSSQNYFSYVFKKELGITPLQYRKKCQKN